MEFKEFEAKVKKEIGWRWYWLKVSALWENHTQLPRDLWWWLTDGEAYWDDAVPCERKLCRHCGNKPFNNPK